MSPEESDNSTRATAIVAPVAETPEGYQPGTTTTAAAVPVASATPITSDTTETKAESVKPVENSEGTDKPAEDKPAEDKPAKDKPAEKPADDKANEAKDESEKESNLDHEPPRTPPARDNYQQPSQYNYPPPARQGFLNVPQDLPYPFFPIIAILSPFSIERDKFSISSFEGLSS